MPAARWNPDNWTAFPNQETQGKSLLTTRVYCWLDFIKIIAKTDCLVLGTHWICSLLASLGLDEEWEQCFFCVKIWNNELWNILDYSTAGSSSAPRQPRKHMTHNQAFCFFNAVTTPEHKHTWRCRTCLTTVLCLEDIDLLRHCWACRCVGSTLAPAGKHPLMLPLRKPKILMTDLLHLLEMGGEGLRHMLTLKRGQLVTQLNRAGGSATWHALWYQFQSSLASPPAHQRLLHFLPFPLYWAWPSCVQVFASS